jgi:hypothetical protein
VEIGLVFGRWIYVNHEADIVDVNASCCNIGGNQNLYRSGTKGCEVSVASILRKSTV